MLLLNAPLAAVPANEPLAAGIVKVLSEFTSDDARDVFAAIRLTQPGGLGRVDEADVNSADAPSISLRAAMQLAADRDLVARQYVDDFAEVFATADRIAAHSATLPLGEAIVRAYLELLRDPDGAATLKKLGVDQIPSFIILDKTGSKAGETFGGIDPTYDITAPISKAVDRLL
jgi:triphosphoribosyl-dephospho-CoA synthase